MKNLVALGLLFFCSVACAQTTLTYTGQRMFLVGENLGNFEIDPFANNPPLLYQLTGTITLSAPLAPNLVNAQISPLAVNFIDKSVFFGPLQTGSVFLYFSTDQSGKITGWNLTFLMQGGLAAIRSSGDEETVSVGCEQSDQTQGVCTALFQGPAGFWAQSALYQSPAVLAYNCISDTNMAPVSTSHFMLSKNANGSGAICQYPKVVPSTWYISTTKGWVQISTLKIQ